LQSPSFASEAKTGGIFIGAQEAIPILNMFIKLVNPQPASATKPLNAINQQHSILISQVV